MGNRKKNEEIIRYCKCCGVSSDEIMMTPNVKTCSECRRNNIVAGREKRKNILREIEVPQYVYKIIDNNDSVIYVGQTDNLDRRIKAHYSSEVLFDIEDIANIKEIQYIKVQNKYISTIYEVHYICLYFPRFNDQYKYKTTFTFDLPELEWCKYIYSKQKGGEVQ